MNTVSIQHLNSIINLANDLMATVCWIRDVSSTKQIYLSDHYSQVWGRPTSELYQNPLSFGESIIPGDDCPRKKNSVGLNLYRIRKPDGSIAFVKDQHFLLIDEQSKSIGKIGFADEVPERLWFELLAGLNINSDKKNQTRRRVMEDMMKKEFNINLKGPEHVPVSTIKLTPSEQICLTYLLKGKVPKQIADQMKVSIKTVEFHIANIKRKYQCRHVLQLISKINGFIG